MNKQAHDQLHTQLRQCHDALVHARKRLQEIDISHVVAEAESVTVRQALQEKI